MDETPNVAAWPPGPGQGQAAVAFEFRMTPDLLARELVANIFRRQWPLVAGAFILFGLTELVKLDWADPDFYGLVRMPLFGLALMVSALYLLGRIVGRRTFETTPLWQRPMQVILTPTRLYMNGPGYQSAQDLALLHAVRESRESFLVYLNTAFMLIWPKQTISDRESLERVREYLREGLPGTAKIKLRND